MFKKKLFLAAVLSTLLACNSQAEVIHSTWVGGERGHWSDYTKWDPAIIPFNTASQQFFVTIDSNSIGPEGVEIFLDCSGCIPPGPGNVVVSQVDCYGKVELTGSELTLVDPNGLRNHGCLKLELKSWGNVQNSPRGLLLADPMEAHAGNLLNEAGAQIQVEGSESLDVYEGSIQNFGAILVIPNGEIWAEYKLENSGLIEMYDGECLADQVLHNQTPGIIRGYGAMHSDQLINNAGCIQSLGGSLLLHSRAGFEHPYTPNWGVINTGRLVNSPGTSLTVVVWVPDVNNQGRIEVNADGSVVFDCNLNNEPNAAISIKGGTLAAKTIRQAAGAKFEGFGSITTACVTIEPNTPSEPNSIIRLTGPTNIVGDVNISKGATLEISDGTTLVTGHCTCTEGTIHMIGGAIILQGGFTNNNCRVIWEPGLYTNVADFNVDGKVNLKDFAYFADTWLWQTAWH